MRVFLIVLDSFGIGELDDAEKFGDKGSNTLKACFESGKLYIPNMANLGLFNIDGVDFGDKKLSPIGAYGKMLEKSNGKDTTVGHWEIAGVISKEPLPTYPNGFPEEVIKEFELKTGRKVLCNKPYSGTEVIKDYGEEHLKTGALIVYTSADSVFQIASHEDLVPIETLYEYCKIARNILVGKHGVGRVIARPFVGDLKNGFKRTANRKDFSIEPPKLTLLDYMSGSGLDVFGVGKISDIFGGRGLTESFKTKSNTDGINTVKRLIGRDFNGICFINLVDFDMVYGHRNDVLGYTEALNYFDSELGEILNSLSSSDVLIITADHGCDPSTPSTDHSRESVPLLIYGQSIKRVNLGVKQSFADLAKTVADMFNIDNSLDGRTFKKDITL
ncbi:MAG: phosphopentomutase [Clostridia bacterium]|nr:phosphopentomutase [Clostridia bacterium]